MQYDQHIYSKQIHENSTNITAWLTHQQLQM